MDHLDQSALLEIARKLRCLSLLMADPFPSRTNDRDSDLSLGIQVTLKELAQKISFIAKRTVGQQAPRIEKFG